VIVQSLKVVIPFGAVVCAVLHATALEAVAGPAWTQVVASKLLNEFDVAVDDAMAAFHCGFRGKKTSGVWP
jgi:hypothetical protein